MASTSTAVVTPFPQLPTQSEEDKKVERARTRVRVMRTRAAEGSPRPFRIWDANAKKHLTGCYYGTSHNAHNGALIRVRWAKVGVAYEVYDARNGRLLGQYLRTPTSILFVRG